jgi:hypothetical protein
MPPPGAPAPGAPPAFTPPPLAGAGYEAPTGQYPYGDAGGGGTYPPGPVPTPGGDGGGRKGLIIGLVVVIVLGLIAVGAILLLGGDDDDTATDDTTDETTDETTEDTTEDTTDDTTEDTTDDTTEDTTEDTTDDTTDDTIDTEGELTSVFDLEEGDCWDDPPASASQVSEVEVVDCDDPHDNEIYLVFDLADGEYDQTQVETDAQDGCLAEFEDFVGIAYEDSRLDVFAIWPTSQSWDEGDREVLCSLYDIDLRKLVGSMEGAEV